MPPKKIDCKTLATKTTEKTPRGRPKKEKKVLKTPSIVKVKIGKRKNSDVAPENEVKPAKIKKVSRIVQNVPTKSKQELKIMLANEVVAAQFQNLNLMEKLMKAQSPTTSPLKKNNTVKNAVPPPKPGRRRQGNIEKTISNDLKGKRIVKKNKTVPSDFKIEVNNSAQDSPEGMNKAADKKEKRTLGRKRKIKVTEESASTEPVKVATENLMPDKPKTLKRNPSLRRKPTAKPGPKSKKNFIDINQNGIDPNKPSSAYTMKKEPTDNDLVNNMNTLRSISITPSEMSWTKEMTSDSTTTCVTVSSKDFVRIDKKIPIIKLECIDNEVHSDKVSDHTTDSSLAKGLRTEGTAFDVEKSCSFSFSGSSLNLSSSSNSSVPISPCKVVSDPKDKLSDLINQISSNLKKIDLEVLNWIGNSDEYNSCELDNIIEMAGKKNILCEERAILNEFRELDRLLMKYEDNDTNGNTNLLHMTDNISTKEIGTDCINDTGQNVSNETKDPIQVNKNVPLGSKESFNSQENLPLRAAGKSAEDNDDDDALSLYAESISEIDTNTKSISVAPANLSEENEEYVPQNVSNPPFKVPITYKPSKIPRREQNILEKDQAIKNVNVCEKHNADSTSINKDSESDNASQDNILFYEDRQGDITQKNTVIPQIKKPPTNPPCFIASLFKPMNGIKSYVFKGVCFFNLVKGCKNKFCKFPHEFVDDSDVRNRLASLSFELFVQEYMLLRVWPILRRMYGFFYVEECIKRRLTRILVEMSIDFIIKADDLSDTDSMLKLSVIELTLLHLNNIDLSTCADLLKFSVTPQKDLLCDYFMTTIAKSQNFSRFRKVFVNLTKFMCFNNRFFSLDVSTNLLERMCILPYDENLARALIEIIKRTNSHIFEDSMIFKFERLLLSADNGFYEEFQNLKEQARNDDVVPNNLVLPSTSMLMPSNETGAMHINDRNQIDKDMRYSPDTTNLDNMNKPFEPIFTRTIDFAKVKQHLVNVPSASRDDETKLLQRPNFKNRGQPLSPLYRNNGRNILDHIIQQRNESKCMRPEMRPMFKRRRDYSPGGSRGKYQNMNNRFT